MPRRAVVVGAGLAGLLAAAALSVHTDEVIVLDRDELPEGPEHRRGLPQGRHAHLLMSGGLAAIDELVPGPSVRAQLLAAGAHEISLNSGMLALTSEGWLRRWKHEGPRMLTCTRALLDWVVRSAVLAGTKTEIRTARALDLLGDARRVTGVRVSTDAGITELDADFVVEASGRGSRIVRWLGALGITGIDEKTVDSGLVNATRIYRRPEGAEHFPLTILQANPYESRPGRAGMVLPIEGDRWMVSLAGTRGGEPPADRTASSSTSATCRTPSSAALVSGAEPLTDIHTSHSSKNVRRYLEKVQDCPTAWSSSATPSPPSTRPTDKACRWPRSAHRYSLPRTGPRGLPPPPAFAAEVQRRWPPPWRAPGRWRWARTSGTPRQRAPSRPAADRLITRTPAAS
ncbi:FAD-dependent monooxygenase [Streptomyces sp. L7]